MLPWRPELFSAIGEPQDVLKALLRQLYEADAILRAVQQKKNPQGEQKVYQGLISPGFTAVVVWLQPMSVIYHAM